MTPRTNKFSADAYRDDVTSSRRLALLLVLASLLAVACGSDSESSATADQTESTDSTTTAAAIVEPTTSDDPIDDESDTDAPTTTESSPVESTSSTTSAPPEGGGLGVLAKGTVTTAAGLSSEWSLTATASTLCFAADLSHPDPEVVDDAGNGVAACLEPEGGLDQMDGGLSLDVGTVDGESTIGFLWGRVSREVIVLTIEHADGSQTPLTILDGPTDVKVFAYVVEVDSIPPVQDLDAVSGTQIEGSEPIRDFLRAGPTYPEVEPLPPTTTPDYPVS